MNETRGSWFERLTGVRETGPEAVRAQLELRGDQIVSKANGKAWTHGTLETPTLAELRDRVKALPQSAGGLAVRQRVANVQDLHRDPSNAGAMFQVASQFNLLEMVGPSVTPEQGIGRYESDHTQGPACAIAAGAGTIFRNYFADVSGQVGQTHDRQVDCLHDLGEALDNDRNRLWQMRNGYALATADGLDFIDRRLKLACESELDHLRGLIRLGLHWQTQVTLDGCRHLVSQAYCSALPVSYSRLDGALWERFARLVLEAAYEATLCAAALNAHHYGNTRLFLTSLGGGAFGNRDEWILDSLGRALKVHAASGLDLVVVSYGKSDRGIERLVTGGSYS